MQPKPIDIKEETIKNAREFKMHEIKQNDAGGGGAGSKQGVSNSKQESEKAFDRNEMGRVSNDGSVWERVWVMGLLYKGCRSDFHSFSYKFPLSSLLFLSVLSQTSQEHMKVLPPSAQNPATVSGVPAVVGRPVRRRTTLEP